MNTFQFHRKKLLQKFMTNELPMQCPHGNHQPEECIDLALNSSFHTKLHRKTRNRPLNQASLSEGNLQLVPNCCKIAVMKHVTDNIEKQIKHEEVLARLRKKHQYSQLAKKSRKATDDLSQCLE